MGCCVSSHKPTSPPLLTKTSRQPSPPLSPTPLPHPLEETVKEVLSEIPKSKPPIPKTVDEEKDDTQLKKTVTADEISEVSEIYSTTMSESVSALTFDELRHEEDGEVCQMVERSPAKLKHGSMSREFSRRQERGIAKSPVRRSDPSPNRVIIVPGRDAGDTSRRRSRSPAIRTDVGGFKQGMGRSPSVKKTGKSPSRVRPGLAEKNREVEGGKWPPTSNESLENPLVSLECFIFL